MMHGREKSEVDLVDHDDVNLSGAYIVQQPLQIGTVGGPPPEYPPSSYRDRIRVQSAWA